MVKHNALGYFYKVMQEKVVSVTQNSVLFMKPFYLDLIYMVLMQDEYTTMTKVDINAI